MTNEEKTETMGCDFFPIHKFMLRDLALAGAELSVFALLYSFFKSRGSFFGSREYIAESTGLTVRSVSTAIKSLKEKRLIDKKDGEDGRVVYTLHPECESKVKNFPIEVKKFPSEGEIASLDEGKNFTGAGKNFPSGGEKISPNNKEYNKEYIKDDILLTREGARESTQKEFFEDEGTEGEPNYREGRSTKRGGRVGNRPVYRSVGRGCPSPFRSPDAPRTQIGREVEARVRKFYEEKRILWKDEIDELLGRK